MKCENCQSGKLIPARQHQIELLRSDGQRHGINMTCAMTENGIRGIMPVILRTCVTVPDVLSGKSQLVECSYQGNCLHPETRAHK